MSPIFASHSLLTYQLLRFVDRDMLMRYYGGGVGHRSPIPETLQVDQALVGEVNAELLSQEELDNLAWEDMPSHMTAAMDKTRINNLPGSRDILEDAAVDLGDEEEEVEGDEEETDDDGDGEESDDSEGANDEDNDAGSGGLDSDEDEDDTGYASL